MGNLISGGYSENQEGNYSSVRKEADDLFRQRKQLAVESQDAYRRGDGARAKQLSNQAKELQRRAEEAQSRAAEEVYRVNNSNRSDSMIDLHGLHVLEAEAAAER